MMGDVVERLSIIRTAQQAGFSLDEVSGVVGVRGSRM